MYIQQGDVLLFSVDRVPEGAKAVKTSGKIILAEGEATGHAHAITQVEKCETFTLADALFIRCNAPVVVTHEEHGNVTLDPGVWRVGIVREYDHFAEEARKVID